jgi:glycosyltransferase involved in cell wall biosynthesis
MRILFISYPCTFYGANRSLLGLIITLKEQFGVKPHVITTREGSFTAELTKSNISWEIKPFKPWVRYRWKSRNFIFAFYRNIEHFTIGIISFLYNAFLVLSTINAQNIRSANIVYSNTLLSPYGKLLSTLHDKPHIWHIREFLNKDYNLYPDFGFKQLKRNLSKENTIAISHAVKIHFDLNCSKTSSVVYNGVISQKDLTPAKVKVIDKSERLNLSIIGLIHKSKGQKEAIDAIYNLKKQGYILNLHIYGDGNTHEVQKHISRLSLKEQVFLKGYERDVKKIFDYSFAVLVCSQNEGFGRVTAEAMAYGTPIIGYANGGTKELIENKKDGLLFDDFGDLPDRIIELISNEGLYNRLIDNGKKKAKQLFTNETYSNSIMSILRTIS